MAAPEHLKETLEHFKQQRQAKIEELRTLEITIRHLQQQVGETPEQQSDLAFALPFASAESKPSRSQPMGEGYKPRADEFFGLSIADAAKAYLEKVGHAVLAEDILRVITSGGCKVGGADPKRTLSITLGQGKREFVATGGGNYGLRKFYPNMPKLGRPEGTAPAKKAKTKRGPKGNARHSGKPKANIAKPKGYDRADVSAAISEALGDHKPKSVKEVQAAVERKVGYAVKEIALYGTLRKKDFEQIEDKYRLRQLRDSSQVVQ